MGADGVVPLPKSFKTHLDRLGSGTTPSAPFKGTGIIPGGAATPPNLGGEFRLPDPSTFLFQRCFFRDGLVVQALRTPADRPCTSATSPKGPHLALHSPSSRVQVDQSNPKQSE